MVIPYWRLTVPHELRTPTEVEARYNISPSALNRMVREGLTSFIRADDERHVRSDDLEKIVHAGADSLTILTCTCGGPCHCE